MKPNKIKPLSRLYPLHNSLIESGYDLVSVDENIIHRYEKRIPRKGRFYKFDVSIDDGGNGFFEASKLSPDTIDFETIQKLKIAIPYKAWAAAGVLVGDLEIKSW